MENTAKTEKDPLETIKERKPMYPNPDHDPEFIMWEEYLEDYDENWHKTTGEPKLEEMTEKRKKMVDGLKELVKTHEGRARVEAADKVNGFQTSEEYIAKIEDSLKMQQLL